MFRRTGSPLLLAFIVSAAAACGSDTVTPLAGDKLSGFSAGQVGDSTPSSPSVPTGTEAMQVGGTIKGVGTGSDTMATAPVLSRVEVKAFRHLGYSGSDVLIGEQVGSPLMTDTNGWFGYLSLLPGKYVVTFTPPANSAFRAIYVTYESRGSSPGNTVASVWGIFLPRK
jgi:hypothetical protein